MQPEASSGVVAFRWSHFAHHNTVLLEDDAVGIGADINGPPNGAGFDRVKVMQSARVPADLGAFPSLDLSPMLAKHVWQMIGANGEAVRITHNPRLVTDDMSQLFYAVLEGVGVVKLPSMVADQHIASGRLVDMLPGSVPQSGVVHAVFPTRRGLLPSIRSFIDFLAMEYRRGGVISPTGR